MSDQNLSTRYALADLRPIDMSKVKAIKLSEAPEEMFQDFVKSTETMLRNSHLKMPDTAGSPAFQDYARVMVNGREVARLQNNGMVETSNSLAAKLDGVISNEWQHGGSGPDLAKSRAETIARLLGGSVAMAKTAITQARYDSLPSLTPTVDHDAMRQDPLYQTLQDTKKARLLFLTQQMA
ncbi:hypothetical protein JHL17_14335 [Azospirillum sp. YIM B02556]|uniref:Uncharacterized protein n=1 Tax=Azospirillum endophyticum TaxID=2800326 RepID=A0ABS1F592_9PROT|nr:hypothetical protein [Azospirillum endophyticum]MBK1838595.1 hypothetical protein [Azospirillum endophyticum]